jgi:hypothetical protein
MIVQYRNHEGTGWIESRVKLQTYLLWLEQHSTERLRKQKIYINSLKYSIKLTQYQFSQSIFYCSAS